MNKLSELFGGLSELINVKSIEAMGIKFFASVAIVLAAFWISRILQRSIDRHMGNGTWNDEDAIFKYKIIVRFIVLVPGVLFAVHVLGFNLSSLFTHAQPDCGCAGICTEKYRRKLHLGHDAQTRTDHLSRRCAGDRRRYGTGQINRIALHDCEVEV